MICSHCRINLSDEDILIKKLISSYKSVNKNCRIDRFYNFCSRFYMRILIFLWGYPHQTSLFDNDYKSFAHILLSTINTSDDISSSFILENSTEDMEVFLFVYLNLESQPFYIISNTALDIYIYNRMLLNHYLIFTFKIRHSIIKKHYWNTYF